MKFLALAAKNLWRNPVRAALTIMGVGTAMFLFTAVISLNDGMRRMLAGTGDDVLVVFDRYQGCPPLSKLPTAHRLQVSEFPGVTGTTPVLFLLSACSRVTDLVAVHGIEADTFRQFRSIDVAEEQFREFAAERGAALVGEQVARRYGWKVGQAVVLEKLGNISFTVRGIFRAPGDSLEHVILVDMEYLQMATDQVGTMTLLLVKSGDPAIGDRIDELFANSAAPTKTTPERAFVSSAIGGITGIIEFSRWVGYAALGMVLIGVGNSLAMTIRDRTREFAILKTLGFRRQHVLGLVVYEAAISSFLGGALGAGLAWVAINQSRFSLSVEGFTIMPHVSAGLVAWALGLAVGVGAIAAAVPAVRAGRLRIAHALRDAD